MKHFLWIFNGYLFLAKDREADGKRNVGGYTRIYLRLFLLQEKTSKIKYSSNSH